MSKPTRICNTILASLDELEFSEGRHAEIDEARAFVRELAKHWPDMPDLQDGIDRFAQYPVTGQSEPVDASGKLL